MKINSISQAAVVLSENQYAATDKGDFVSVLMGNRTNPVQAIVTIVEKEMFIVCELAKVGNIRSKDFNKATLTMLCNNNAVLPYGFDIETGSDNRKKDKAEDWPIVLINSVPLGDLSKDELLTAFDKLSSALVTAAKIIKPFLEKTV
jgi:hypothetical protein